MKQNKLYFIPYNVPSSKNSRIMTSRGSFHSKTVRKYLQNIGVQKFSSSKKTIKEYVTRPNLFKKSLEGFKEEASKYDDPLKIGFHFVRGTAHKFDFHNAIQIVADLMVAHDMIEDDNMHYFLPFPMEINNKVYELHREAPGVYLKILNK